MKAKYRHLVEHSLNTALSAIEIYNKPDFRDREQIFSILIVTAWESLLKAKILKDSGNKMVSLYVLDDSKSKQKYLRNRSGNLRTITIGEAIKRCAMPAVVAENVFQLIEIRDAAIHLTSTSSSLPYLVFTLGTATLQNYSRLIRLWFDVGLGDYNFYIMPLGFAHSFHTLTTIDLKREPESIANIIASLSEKQQEEKTQDGEFYLLCEINTTLVSAKKITEDTDIVAKIDQESGSTIIVRRDISIIDQYPYTFGQIWKRIKEEVPFTGQNLLIQLIRNHDVKHKQKWATYNYRSKLDELRGPSATTPVLYNESFLRFAVEELRKQCDD